MAKTYTFDEALNIGTSEPVEEPKSARSPTSFTFQEAMGMQPAAPVAEPVTAAPAPVVEAPTLEAPTLGTPTLETPAVSPSETPAAPKSTSGFDVGAMPEQFKSGLAGMQQGWFANIGRNNAAILNVMDAIDRGEYVVPEKDVIGYQEMTPEQRAQYKDTFLKALGSNIEAYQEYKKEQEGYTRNRTADEFIKLADKDDYAGAWKAFKSDPLGIIQQLSVESLPNMLPSVAGGVAGLALRGGLANIAVGVGTGSFPVEFMGSIAESLSESGVNLKDPKAIEAMLRDPKFIDEAGKRAVTRGQFIGFSDAIAAGTMSPLVAGNIIRNIGIAAGNLIKGLLGEGVGEAGAMTTSGEEIKVGQVLAEMIGAGPQTVASTALSTVSESRKPAESAPKAEPTIEPTPEGATPETTTTEEPTPSTGFDEYGYLDDPEYKDLTDKIEVASDEYKRLTKLYYSLEEDTPEKDKSLVELNDYFQKNLNPLLERRREIKNEWAKQAPETVEPAAEPTAETVAAPETEGNILWLDEKAMQDELSAPAEEVIAEAEPVAAAPERVEPELTETETNEIKAPAAFRYSLTESPAYEGVEPLSQEDADFELSVLQERAKRGKLTPEAFAQSEVAKRLDTAQVMEINEGLRTNQVATVEALIQALTPVDQTETKIKTETELKPGDTLSFDEAMALPPKLTPPEGFKLRKGRNEQVSLAARELAAGNITKEEYDRYVDAYTPISTVANPEPLMDQDSMFDILTTKLGKNNKKPELVDAPIADGTRVGLRMDIPALEWGKANGQNGSVVSIHEGRDPDLKTQGPNISYKTAGVVDNPVFAVRSEERAFGVAQNLPDRKGEKTPQQTIEGTWVNMDPKQVYAEIQANLNNPEWTQVSLDPMRHSFFYDRATGQPVLSADRVLQAGRFVLAKNVKFGNRQDFLYNVPVQEQSQEQIADQQSAEQIREENISRYAALKQRLAAIQRRFVEGMSKQFDAENYKSLYRVAQDLKDAIRFSKEPKTSPADFLARAAQELAKGNIEQEVFDVINQIYQKNPGLLDGIRLSVKTGDGEAAGQFFPTTKIVRLFKGTEGVESPATIRHELVHSLEQMMPQDAQAALVDAWAKALLKATQKAKTNQEKLFFVNVGKFMENPTNETMQNAIASMPDYSYYQYINPSEFWAVNAEKLMASYLGGAWQRFKTSVKALFESLKKAFGFDNNSAIYKTFNSVINAKGERTSPMLVDYVTLVGSLLPTNMIVTNYKGKPAPSPTWSAPKKTMATQTAYNLFNEQTYLKRINELLEGAYSIPGQINAYTKELLKNSRAAYRSKMFHLKEVRPILNLMRKYKISDDQLTQYAQAKFAKQRNKQIEDRGGMADGGSGMFNQDAEDYLKALSPKRTAQLEEVRQRIKNIITGTQNIYVDSGAETQNTINRWNEDSNSEYVPLNRKDEDFAMGSSGLGGIGYSASGRSTKMATGSIDKEVKSILENVIHQRDVAIERAERIRVGKAIYSLALKYPNPKFWLPISPDAIKNKQVAMRELQQLGLTAAEIDNLMSQPKVARIDPDTGKLTYQADSTALNAENVLVTKVNGKNRYVIFNKNDPVAMQMIKSLKSLPVEEAGAVLGLVGKATRFWSAITTQFNPIWGLFVNMPRDLLWMYSTLSSTPIMGNKWEMTKKVIPAMIGSWQALRAERSGEPVTGHWAKTFQDAATEGARTMFRDSWVNAREDGEFLRNEMAKLDRGNVKKAVFGLVNVLEDFNNMLESSIRLAAYDTAINQAKLTKEQAARISKEITVNFDRRGAKTLYARNLYAFFNAALQGTSKLYEVLKSPAGKSIMASMVGIGVLQALALAMAGLGDGDVPDYEKEKNFIIPIGGKEYIKIPMPQGLSIFVNLGRLAVEMPLDVTENKGRNMGKKVGSLMSSISNAFNPFGESSNLVMGLLPTLSRPIASVIFNQDTFGRKISKPEFPGKPSPGYLRTSEKSNPVSKGVAEAINMLTGGSEFKKGGVSPTGDDIDYLAKQYAGGLGREITGIAKFGAAIAKGEPLEVNQIPVISKYFGTSDRRGAVARNFYDNVNEIAERNFEYKSYLDADKEARADFILRKYPEAELHNQAQALVRQISKMSKMRDQAIKENAPKSEVRALENEQLLLMREFNREVNMAKRR